MLDRWLHAKTQLNNFFLVPFNTFMWVNKIQNYEKQKIKKIEKESIPKTSTHLYLFDDRMIKKKF